MRFRCPWIVTTFLAATALAAPMRAGADAARDDHASTLNFEACGAERSLQRWSGGPRETMFLDSTVTHGGRYAGRIERDAGSPADFTTFTMSMPIDFTGKVLELRGWMKLENVRGFAGLWQRQDGPGGAVQFDNMQRQHVDGTRGWTFFSVPLVLDATAHDVFFGALLAGTGRMWVDDLSLWVDGRPVVEATARPRVLTAIEKDHEFDAGSKIALTSATRLQQENLERLARVWGFLKYHHRRVVNGELHWDYELFRVMPAVLAARDRNAAEAAIERWLDRIGPMAPCSTCAARPKDAAMMPRLGWLADRAVIGPRLGERLRTIYDRRDSLGSQFYAGLQPAGNPNFGNENSKPDSSGQAPDAGYRLLALFRYWNIIEYWSPNRDTMGEDWDAVLREFIPRVLAVRTRHEYELAMMSLIYRIHDSHANLWSSIEARPPEGERAVPAALRFVQGKAVVFSFPNDTLGRATGLQIGDVVRAVDRVPVDTLVARWSPFYCASNEASRRRDIARSLTQGERDSVTLTVERRDQVFETRLRRVTPEEFGSPPVYWGHSHPGDAFRRLSDDVAYLTLANVREVDAPDYVKRAAGAKLLILDIRDYPSEFMVFSLGNHLVTKSTEFARFTNADPSNPGAFRWTDPVVLTPAAPTFEGKIAILVDEVSQSQAEYTTMAFRAVPGAIVVGSTTAGADGNVSSIRLPGKLRTLISGIGVFYPDKRPTQIVGIVPDVFVTPTIAGLRAGRDEVLEAAVRKVLGRDMTEAERNALEPQERASR